MMEFPITELMDGRKLVECYGARFQSEFLFRDSKQFTGRADCQARAEATLDFHFTVALATRNLARAEELRAQTGQLAPSSLLDGQWETTAFQ
jgi:hypothetical protein